MGEIPPVKHGLDSSVGKEQVGIVVESLKKGTKPRKEATLIRAIRDLFKKSPLSEERTAAILEELKKRKFITIVDGKINYSLPS